MVRGNRKWTKRTGKMEKFLLIGLMAYMSCQVFAADWTAQTKCITCTDVDRCPNVRRIFDTQEEKIYERAKMDPLPLCANISGPAFNECTVCSHQKDIHIYCAENVTIQDVEDDDSHTSGSITNLTDGCKPIPKPISDGAHNNQTNGGGSGHPQNLFVVIGVLVICGVVLGVVALGVRRAWKKKAKSTII